MTDKSKYSNLPEVANHDSPEVISNPDTSAPEHYVKSDSPQPEKRDWPASPLQSDIVLQL